MKPKKIRIHTDEIRSIDANELHGRGTFYRRMKFPFVGHVCSAHSRLPIGRRPLALKKPNALNRSDDKS
jgi:hypothetical protein